MSISRAAIEGHWQGALVRAGSVQVVLVDFARDGDAFKTTIEIPDLVISVEWLLQHVKLKTK